ncbi:type I secretion C-terminal target domain-containing protein, partial [Campylobacter jejuni]
IFEDNAGANVINAGAGDDEIRYVGGGRNEAGGADTITLGAGNDTLTIDGYSLYAYPSNQHADIVTDFVAGGGETRDVIDLNDVTSYLTGWDSSTNPFATGFLRLLQSGSNTLLQYDRDGAGTGFGWVSVLQLNGVTVTALTAANFIG